MTYVQQAAVDVAAVGANIVIPGVAGKRTRVHGLDVFLAGAATVQLKSAATLLTGVMTTTAYSKPLSNDPYFVGGPGEDLIFTLGAAVRLAGAIWFRQD
jgi:hypothetical protein